jgi:hypothetical protein
LPQVGRRGDADKVLELVDHVGLIAVAVTDGDLCPIDLGLPQKGMDDPLEPEDFGEPLRSEADLSGESAPESLREQAQLF